MIKEEKLKKINRLTAEVLYQTFEEGYKKGYNDAKNEPLKLLKEINFSKRKLIIRIYEDI